MSGTGQHSIAIVCDDIDATWMSCGRRARFRGMRNEIGSHNETSMKMLRSG